MDLIKDLLVDALNGFSLRFIPFFLLQLLSAGFFAYILQILFKKKFEAKLPHIFLIAVAVALLTALGKNSLPIAVLGTGALLLLLKLKELKQTELILLITTVVIGIGCGYGSIVQTFLGTVILALIVLFIPLKK